MKLLILEQLKLKSQPWDTFMFKVLNPHLNIQKFPWHLHHQESNPSLSLEKKSPNVVHLDDDTSEVSPSTHSIPISAEFIPLPRPRTRDQKEKFAQSMVQSATQTTHSDSVAKLGKPDITSLYTLASISAKMLEDDDHETIPAPLHEIFFMPV